MFCANCGALIDEEAKFCLICGESLTEGPAEETFLEARGLKWFKKIPTLKKLRFRPISLDFSFSKFSATKTMKFIYGGSMLLAGLITFIFAVLSFQVSTGLGIFTLLVIAPLIFLLALIYSRLLMRIVFEVDHMANQAKNLSKKTESSDTIQWNID